MGDLRIHDKIKVGYNALSAPKDGQKPTTTACPPPTPADADEWSYAPAPRILAAELTKRLLSILVQDDPKITPEAAEAMARKWAPPSLTLTYVTYTSRPDPLLNRMWPGNMHPRPSTYFEPREGRGRIQDRPSGG